MIWMASGKAQVISCCIKIELSEYNLLADLKASMRFVSEVSFIKISLLVRILAGKDNIRIDHTRSVQKKQ
jgi:hypothetical protein